MSLVYASIEHEELNQRRVLVREDFNVPMLDRRVQDPERIVRAVPTLRLLLDKGARVVVVSHLGRPQPNIWDQNASLHPVASVLSEYLAQQVPLVQDWRDTEYLAPGSLALLENIRFSSGEKENDPELAKKLASLCDVFVMDAFSVAHRMHASTVGIAQCAPISFAGPLLLQELNTLNHMLNDCKRPWLLAIAGSKISTKIHVLKKFLKKVDQFIIGGAMANTFLNALGYSIGRSLYEPHYVSEAMVLMQEAQKRGISFHLPQDVLVSHDAQRPHNLAIRNLNSIQEYDIIVDVGPCTQAHYGALCRSAASIVWNGPMGIFEIDEFSRGTRALVQAMTQSHAYTLCGGGDTLCALKKVIQGKEKISYCSTGGGALLEYLSSGDLPILAHLKKEAL